MSNQEWLHLCVQRAGCPLSYRVQMACSRVSRQCARHRDHVLIWRGKRNGDAAVPHAIEHVAYTPKRPQRWIEVIASDRPKRETRTREAVNPASDGVCEDMGRLVADVLKHEYGRVIGRDPGNLIDRALLLAVRDMTQDRN